MKCNLILIRLCMEYLNEPDCAVVPAYNIMMLNNNFRKQIDPSFF
jgi:hypothetical protein